MTTRFRVWIFLCCAWVATPAALAAGQPELDTESVFGSETVNRSAYLFDAGEGTILFNKNADRVNALASLTKLMTALVAYETSPPWNESVVFEASDRRPGNIPYIGIGESVTRENLWNLMLVASSNDAVAALVRSLGFSESDFADRMNARARSLGLGRLHFVEPTGLNAGNVGTAREVAALARVAFAVPKIRESLQKISYRFAPAGKTARRAFATNILLASSLNHEPYRVIAGKTGFTEESKYNLVFAGAKNGRNLIGVVLGSPTSDDRFQSMKGLLYWGFEKQGDALASR